MRAFALHADGEVDGRDNVRGGAFVKMGECFNTDDVCVGGESKIPAGNAGGNMRAMSMVIRACFERTAGRRDGDRA